MGIWKLEYNSQTISMCLEGESLEELINGGLKAMKVAYEAYNAEGGS